MTEKNHNYMKYYNTSLEIEIKTELRIVNTELASLSVNKANDLIIFLFNF